MEFGVLRRARERKERKQTTEGRMGGRHAATTQGFSEDERCGASRVGTAPSPPRSRRRRPRRLSGVYRSSYLSLRDSSIFAVSRYGSLILAAGDLLMPPRVLPTLVVLSPARNGHLPRERPMVCMRYEYVMCRKAKNSQARTGHQRGMGGRGTGVDGTRERHTDTHKLTQETLSQLGCLGDP